MPARQQRRRSVGASLPCPTCRVDGCKLKRTFESHIEEPFAEGFDMAHVARGEHLETSGGAEAELSVVLDGMIVIEASLPDGRRQVTGFRTAGDVLAPCNRCDNLAFDMTAVMPTHICRIRPRGASENPWQRQGLADTLLDMASARLAAAERHLLLLARLTAGERMASFLLEMAVRIGRPGAAGLSVELPMNREVIADYLGLHPETVSRQFTRLKRRRAITLPRPGLVLIESPERLAAETPLSQFTPPPFEPILADAESEERSGSPCRARKGDMVALQ